MVKDHRNKGHGETPVKANIFAAGAVVWRPREGRAGTVQLDEAGGKHHSPSGSAFEVAIIHRPKYDDWSFPKGKLDPGETAVVAAMREIGEETGFVVRLGRFLRAETYPVPGHRKLKRVQFWSAQYLGGEFLPNKEVDELLWLSPEEALEHLSYPMDRQVLRKWLEIRPDTSTLLLVRHGKAGSRKRFQGDDALRPLDEMGRAQAQALVAQLLAFGAAQVHAADRRRCIQTVEPLAHALSTPIVVEPVLTEEAYADDASAAQQRVRTIAESDVVQVVCSQGGVIPPLLRWWAELDGVTLPASRNRKGSTWVLSLLDGKLVAVDHLPSPLPVELADTHH